MTDEPAEAGFVQRYLDPASRLGEILFGLIMVLGVTLTAGVTVAEGKEGVRGLLYSALGCNIAWGIIDGVMYIMNCITVRSEESRLIRAIRRAPDPGAALAIVRRELEPKLRRLAAPAAREALYPSILERLSHAEPTKTRVTRDDVYGAIACFWLVFVSCLPAAIPFLIFSTPGTALRVSNGLLIAMLFAVGHKWAQYNETNRLLAGLAMLTIGMLLVGVAVLLGG
jgi:hypothetical protein